METKMFDQIPKTCRYAYARVSSKSQEENSSLEFQKQEFIQQGVPEKNIRIEIGSDADTISDATGFLSSHRSRIKRKRFVTCY